VLKRFAKLVLGTLLVGYVVLGILLYLNQQRLLYHPTPDLKIPYKKMVLKQQGAKVAVYVLHPGKTDAIIYFGGNGESMAQSAPYLARQFPNFTCYLMDYRGYGASTGEPEEKSIYADALALYDTVAPHHRYINVGGRSLGTGVATYVAAQRDVRRVVLITPYESIKAVAQDLYPLFPVSLLLKDTYDSLSRVPRIKAQTLIIMAEKDRVIPKIHTQKLIEAFNPSQLKVIMIKNRGHQDISDDPDYFKVMQTFIREGSV
jgi:pimeloyl-ACP methyl ester carboxylesterase